MRLGRDTMVVCMGEYKLYMSHFRTTVSDRGSSGAEAAAQAVCRSRGEGQSRLGVFLGSYPTSTLAVDSFVRTWKARDNELHHSCDLPRIDKVDR